MSPLAHGIGLPVPTRADDGFALNVADLERAWEPGCKVLMMNMPCNPTGGTSDRGRLEKIARFAVEKDLIVLSDEIYSELVYDNPHTSIAVFPGMRERTLFLHGFSKAFAMTGFRIGYACGPAELVDAMMKVHQYSMLCAPILSQEAAIEALARGEDGVKAMRDQYHRRRDLVVRRLNAAGLACRAPGGAVYRLSEHRRDGSHRSRIRLRAPRGAAGGRRSRSRVWREWAGICARELCHRIRTAGRGL